eukprot:353590-Chlamydomonas_euryale.AAC.11
MASQHTYRTSAHMQEPVTEHRFADIKCLDPECWEWSDVEAKGTVPPARHSHVCSVIAGQAMVSSQPVHRARVLLARQRVGSEHPHPGRRAWRVTQHGRLQT